MEALILGAKARTAHIRDTPQPAPASTELLVRVKAIALNPIDPLYIRHPLGRSGRLVGSDFAGAIVQTGSDIPTDASLRVEHEVAGYLQGACSVNERPGAFAEFVVVPSDLVLTMPNSVTVEQVTGVSPVALTAAQTMWYRLGMAAPFAYDRKQVLQERPDWRSTINEQDQADITNVFIYGASTSIALFAAQMVLLSAKSSGKAIKLYGAAREARWKLLRAEPYGYDALVDYQYPDWSGKTRGFTGGVGIHYAFDCISEASSIERTCSTLTPDGKTAIVRSREGGA
ncbi:hypothetical protein G6011_02099 [Alternaria panax]|uniref:Enoyl reductase (ER) domain-containing protein n=1 Tax=Alternaria panax TaxID=48097 RepID=A0AAD4FG87_9PLEO|nr:hypothetical protein G6011_02099 [Alternaria panax]